MRSRPRTSRSPARGTLDGQADAEHVVELARRWSSGALEAGAGADRLLDMGVRGVPVQDRVFGPGTSLRPNFIQPYRSRNVLIEGVTIVNSPMWEINPVLCHERHGPRRRRSAATARTTTAAIRSRAATC